MTPDEQPNATEREKTLAAALVTSEARNEKLTSQLSTALKTARGLRFDGPRVQKGIDASIRSMPGKVRKVKAETFWMKCPSCWEFLSHAFQSGKSWKDAMVGLQSKLDESVVRVNTELAERAKVDPAKELEAWKAKQETGQACIDARVADGFTAEQAADICNAVDAGAVEAMLEQGRAKTVKQALAIITRGVQMDPVAKYLAGKIAAGDGEPDPTAGSDPAGAGNGGGDMDPEQKKLQAEVDQRKVQLAEAEAKLATASAGGSTGNAPDTSGTELELEKKFEKRLSAIEAKMANAANEGAPATGERAPLGLPQGAKGGENATLMQMGEAGYQKGV